MKRLVLAAVLAASPAVAQQLPPDSGAAQLLRRCTVELSQMIDGASALAAERDKARKDLAEMTAERDALKASQSRPPPSN